MFIGLCCIHYRKTFSTYLFFASTLISQCKQLEGVRVLGTDGDVALSDALKDEFGFAQHSFSKKCERPAPQLHQVASSILEDIFGEEVGSTHVEGLVDSVDTIDFNEKAEKLVGQSVAKLRPCHL